jgi:predicted nucleic acid-binding protein
MPVMPRVLADVVDIRTDSPRRTDTLVADTNIWVLLSYTPVAMVNRYSYQTVDYSSYVKRLMTAGASLAHSSLTLAEMAHAIERTEWRIWQALPGRADAKLKEFRREDAERARVLEEVDDAWETTKSMSSCVDCTLDAHTADATLERLRLYPIDGYDALILATMRGRGFNQLLSDDADFVTVGGGLTVFTANREAIRLAELQRRLVRRP